MQKNTARPLAIGLMILGALIRVTQHWNFAPVGAMSLFAGARNNFACVREQRFLLPLATDKFTGGRLI